MARKSKGIDMTATVGKTLQARFGPYVNAPENQRDTVEKVRALWDKAGKPAATREGSEDSSVIAEVAKIARICKASGNAALVKLNHPALPVGTSEPAPTIEDFLKTVKIGK